MPKGDGVGPIYPFRWDIKKRSHLGRLVDALNTDRATWWDTDRTTWWYSMYSYEWFLSELTHCAARVIALCGDSDLCFVGRSPESLFDYLSGLLLDTSWADRLTLLHFSMMRGMSEEELERSYPGALKKLREYMVLINLDPQAIAVRERTIAFVDIVALGGTFGNLIGIIHNWCKQTGFDWNAVRRKIRIVGLTEQEETSPKTWRWHQHAEWTDVLAKGAIKNVSIPAPLFHFLGGGQLKTTKSYSPRRWGDPEVMIPTHDAERLQALQMAVALFDDGREITNKLTFAAELRKQPAMQHRWFRSLVRELKGQ